MKWQGNPELKRHLAPLAKIGKDPENARKHSEELIRARSREMEQARARLLT